MKHVGILLAAGVLFVAGSAARAENGGGAPGTLQPVPVVAAPASSCCKAAACAQGHHEGHRGRFCDWLLYKPPHTACACHCAPTSCYPPLYTWFLDMCHGGCGGAGCGHAACAAAGGGDAPPAHPE
jgi:hypothetical protein